ncbi:hypothetical protein DERF_011236 [Dermatophagoides farinae]|uniref:Uncharacterized protein n=1 Tax=Dermatophagoides farinae TaxID=6954 RepID=A0A922HRU4_DERFA|nr:hypothetical protein DERF_011236 [Dermatophagoides farinae]
METLKSDNVTFCNQMLNKHGHPLFFQLSEQKIIQVTTLISDYIEMKKQQQQQQQQQVNRKLPVGSEVIQNTLTRPSQNLSLDVGPQPFI